MSHSAPPLISVMIFLKSGYADMEITMSKLLRKCFRFLEGVYTDSAKDHIGQSHFGQKVFFGKIYYY